jgi:transposase
MLWFLRVGKEPDMAKDPTRLTDEQWAKIEPLLPTMRASPRGGRKPVPNRPVFEGILWVLRSGARWKDLPKEYPSPSTCWRRLRDWEEQGVWERVWRAFLKELDEKGLLDWEETFADGSFASAKKGATASARRDVEKARSGWWWWTAKVFLLEAASRLPRRRK